MLGSSASIFLCVAVFGCLYSLIVTVYRLFFHPLAHIPGPPLAIATYLYEWYYDLYCKGQYTFQLKKLHKKYGPIIRINPDVIHIDDLDYHAEVFNMTNGRVQKSLNEAEALGPYPATIGTRDHELHRVRRSAVNPFFSKRSVSELLPTMLRPTEILCKRLEEASRSDDILNMKHFYAAVTQDIINDYCFARDPEYILRSDFGRKSFDDLDSFLEACLVNYHIPWATRFIYSLPDNINKILTPAMADILDFRRDLSRQVEAIRHGHDEKHKAAAHRTVFHELLDSKLPPQELGRDRLRDEAFQLVTAGSTTTAYVLRGTAYHISANPSVRQRLWKELKTAIPDPNGQVSLPELEKLPYLTAVIQEGLRLSDPVGHRITRQFPDKTLDYHGKTIPAGATVSMTTLLIHQNEDIFPEPLTYRPERWLGATGKPLERYLVSFSRGPRACLGINLARAELYLILALIYRRFDFDVSAVVRERDIDFSRDFLLAAQAKDTPGILVKVRMVDEDTGL